MLNIFPRLCCLSRTVAPFRFQKQFIRHGDFICSAFMFHFNFPSLPRKQINSQLNLSLLATVSSLWSLPCLSFSPHFLFTPSCSFFFSFSPSWTFTQKLHILHSALQSSFCYSESSEDKRLAMPVWWLLPHTTFLCDLLSSWLWMPVPWAPQGKEST